MKRRGVTLIEVLIVVGVLTVLSAITGPLFVRMLRDLRAADRLVREGSVITDMVQSMRDDMTQARSVRMTSDQTDVAGALLIELPDRTVCYQFENDRWVRRRYDPDAESDPDELDSWVLPLAYIEYELWHRDDSKRAFAVEIHTAVMQEARPQARLTLANSHVLFVGAAGGGQ